LSAIFDFKAINRKADEIAAQRETAISGVAFSSFELAMSQQTWAPDGWTKLKSESCDWLPVIRTGAPRAGTGVPRKVDGDQD
jgi:hypothetical protein